MNLYTYGWNSPINGIDPSGHLFGWAKKLIAAVVVVAVVAVVAAVVVATAGAGSFAAAVAVGAAKGAAVGAIKGAVGGAVIGAATGAIKHRIETGSWEGAGQAALESGLDGMASGALGGAIGGAVSGGINGGVKYVESHPNTPTSIVSNTSNSANSATASNSNASSTTTNSSKISSPDNSNVSSNVHGNSLNFEKTNYGYELKNSTTGETLKYGESIHGTKRYTQKFYDENNCYMKIIKSGSKRDIHIWQHERIVEYFDEHGYLPPLNKSFWYFVGGIMRLLVTFEAYTPASDYLAEMLNPVRNALSEKMEKNDYGKDVELFAIISACVPKDFIEEIGRAHV